MEGKGIIWGVAIILILGGLLSFMLSSFEGIDFKEGEDNWAEPFANFFSDILRGINAILAGTLHFLRGMANIPLSIINSLFGTNFGSGSGEPHTITISGTGYNNFGWFGLGNITLDGNYNYEGRIILEEESGIFGEKDTARFVNEDNRRLVIHLYINNYTQEAEAVYLGRYNFWGTFIPIYEGIGTPDLWNTFQLIDTDLDFNLYASSGFEVGSIETTFAGAVYEFLENVNERVTNSILVLGLMPESVGIPLMIIVILMITIGIIKLLPFV